MSVVQESCDQRYIPTSPVEPLLDGDTWAFGASLLVHVALLVALGFSTYLQETPIREALVIQAPVEPQLEEREVHLPEDFFMNDHPTPEVGANSTAESDMALSAAEVLSQISDIPSPADLHPVEIAKLEVNNTIEVATGLRIDHLPVRGAAGEGITGAVGAIDRITQDILLSLEERPTLVLWLFDQSGSLTRQRASIHERFDRVYHELGVIEAAGNPAFKRHDDKPLLTSVIAFGDQVNFLTHKPTDSLSEIKAAVAEIKQDDTGVERVFTAIYMAVEKYRKYRTESPIRNIMVVVFTDEAGDDQAGLDKTVNLCRRLEVPVYVVGVPAPFGREETLVKWVDPDPAYDQSPQWGAVSQGPESLFPERVKLRFMDDQDPDPLDSGFGPFALTRLCYETGGIYFAVHPNRNVNRQVGRQETDPFSAYIKHFFDPEAMRKYRPDYVPAKHYLQLVNQNKARSALLNAAQLTWLNQLEEPRLRFVKRDEAQLATELADAQKVAAKLEPQLASLYETLHVGVSDRGKETSPRWQAGFDLAIGRVLAAKVRAEGYNAMLAAAKRGLKFTNDKNNTWILRHDQEVSTGSQLAKDAKQAEAYLQRVVTEHPGTPWALLAEKELQTPLGWKWTEQFTDLSPPRNTVAAGNNNAPPRPAQNEQKKMLPPPTPKRPIPKL